MRCGGRFGVGLRGAATVQIDYVVLQPGPWGRFANLTIRRQTAEALRRALPQANIM